MRSTRFFYEGDVIERCTGNRHSRSTSISNDLSSVYSPSAPLKRCVKAKRQCVRQYPMCNDPPINQEYVSVHNQLFDVNDHGCSPHSFIAENNLHSIDCID